ncbi:D-glycero-alpha-D-manno-heptose-1,7-bisphosphate 7-phosphatase [Mycolicibacter acidiphilus]|nr:HAD-IIIA family hydrolase [Mycolicibacter acidiphilus]
MRFSLSSCGDTATPTTRIPLAQLLRATQISGLFLDRDGVINVKAPEGRYVTSPDDLVLMPGAAAAIRHVNQLDVPVYVVTNQRWVTHHANGVTQLHRVHHRLHRLLGSTGAHVDGIYACTHEIDRCDCRKPARGLVDQVLEDHPALALASCALVGDSETDIELATECGLYAVLVSAGHAEVEATAADEIAPDLHAAVVGDTHRPSPAVTTEER